jgi:ABC-2 type transport system permease protein
LLRAFFSERTKLRRKWMVLGVFGPLVAFSVGSTIFQIVLADKAGTPEGFGLRSTRALASAQGLANVITDSAAFGGVIVVILFATGFATEYGWGTLRNLLVRQPRRVRLFLGKSLGLLDFTYLGVLLMVGASFGAASLLAPGQGISTEAWFTADGIAEVVKATVNLMLSTIGWASLGILASVLLRSPGPAVGVVLAFFPVEGLVATLWDKAPEWLPGRLFGAVAVGGTEDVDFDRALALSMGYSLVALAIALWMFARSDVTA